MRTPKELEVDPSGNAFELIRAIQQTPSDYSRAIDRLGALLKENDSWEMKYTELPDVSSFLDFVRDKRAFLDENGNFDLPDGQVPQYIQNYLQRINSRMLWRVDIKTIVDKAIFILVPPDGWASLGHHYFNTYRGDTYGPGWAEPKYGLFGDKPRGFEISFRIASGYDSRNIIRKHCPTVGGSSRLTVLGQGLEQFSFSKDESGNFEVIYVPIRNKEWRTSDIVGGDWGKGWQVFGLFGEKLNLSRHRLSSDGPDI